MKKHRNIPEEAKKVLPGFSGVFLLEIFKSL
jgi:hypothetical protein